LVGDGPATGDQRDTGGRSKQGAGIAAHQVGAQRVDHALRELFAETRPQLTAPHGGLDRDLKILQVGGRMLVDDDKVNVEAFHAPIFVGPQQLANLGDVRDIVDTQENDRQVAGNAVRPKP
jgi:hypothetical protein